MKLNLQGLQPLVLPRDPQMPLEAATKNYVDTVASIHEGNQSLHLTSAQNAWMDAITVSADEINSLAGLGGNLTETLNDVTAHAEMQAITAAANFLGGKYLTDCTLYVTVEPCVMCAGALGWSQISRIVYGASDEKRGFTRFAPDAIHPKTEVVAGVLEEECSALMKEFFKKKR